MAVNFFFNNVSITLLERRRLKAFIERLFKAKHGKLSNLTYVFCTDRYLLDMNQKFLDHDYYTDIITFTLSEPDQPIEGEIYISADRVKENARNLGKSVKNELHRVIFHGALHLCGYEDETQVQKDKMTQEENKWLLKYFKEG